MANKVPVVLFTYNRPVKTKKTIEALKKNYLSSDTILYVFSDGPKNNNDIAKINEVRNYLENVSDFKKVEIKKNNINKGLADSIINGVTEIFTKHNRLIVLEDDLLTAPNFLDFMNQALDYYEYEDRVLSISGYTFEINKLYDKKDFYFGHRASSWGWATWKNQWEKIDWEVSNYDEFINNKRDRVKFKKGGSDLVKMLKDWKKGKNDSWAIRLCYHQFRNDLITVFPSVSKIQNIGFSQEATHTKGGKRFETKLDKGVKREFEFEKFQEIDPEIAKEFRKKYSVKARAMDKIRTIISL